MRLFKYRYQSYHKPVTAIIILILIWGFYHFSDKKENKYYPNGQMIFDGPVQHNQNHGLWTWWYENGQKEMQGSFTHGKRTGIWRTWDRKGILRTEGMYVDDKLNGEFKEFDELGKLIRISVYANDVRVQVIE